MKVKKYLKITEGIKVVNICKIVACDEDYGTKTDYIARYLNFKSALEYADKRINYVNLEYKKDDGLVANIYIK